MKRTYTGYYRTQLSQAEKERFKNLALQRGSVVEIHDELIREFIRKEEGDDISGREHFGGAD